jgi:hypothetical protein
MSGLDIYFDGDGDGLSDAWEFLQFGNLSHDGAGDFDQDGLSNLREFQLGTDPMEAASPGRFRMVTWEGGSVSLDFLGMAGRAYEFESSLDHQQWFLVTNRVHPGGVLQITDPAATNAARVYRARLLP